LKGEDAMQSLAGTTIKGYELREQIGVGGFGAVYRAYQPIIDREVAMKIILPEHANQPEFIRGFEAEAQFVARLEHPYIVPLFDFWRDPDGAFLVMRLLRGGSLAKRLRQGALSLEDTLRLVEQITAALHVAHRNGIVHRDLKPDNILLDEEGNAYLTDFGIAKLVGGGSTEQNISGSIRYIAPEQLRAEPASTSVDMYSLGLMIYEMLTGQYPFGEATITEIVMKHLEEPLPDLSEALPDAPYRLNAILQQATAKDPAQRYADVRQIAGDMRQAIQANAGLALEVLDWQAIDPAQVVNPYKGLRAFQEADSADFFGREALVERLLGRLSEDQPYARFLNVVGPSGSGKSSVVRAGLLPALRQGRLPGSDRWFIVDMLPGAQPLRSLEAALLSVALRPPSRLYEMLRADSGGLVWAVDRVLADVEGDLLLVIDQFEELFTNVEDEAERLHFLSLIQTAISDPDSRLRVIVTLRADFTDRPLEYVDFGELVRQRTEFILPLSAQEIERAISGPAQRVGLIVESELVAAIVADVREEPGALPLLQYALTEVFERREGLTLTLKAYQDSGGVLGALARRAEEVYLQLDLGQQRAARQMFLRLVTLGEGVEDTRRRARRSEIAAIVPSPQTLQSVLDAFGQFRLLTFDYESGTREPTLEVAHEALIREWKRVREWLDLSRGDVRLQRVLAGEANEWLKSGRDSSFLLSGARLAQYEEWQASTDLALTPLESDYIRASIDERQRKDAAEVERKRREEETAARAEQFARRAAQLRRASILLGVVVAGAVLATFALIAQVATTQTEVAQGQTQIAQVEPTLEAAEGQIATAQQQVAGVQPTLQAAQEQIEAAEAQIAAVQPTLAAGETQIAGVQPTLQAANAQVEAANAQVAAVQPTVQAAQGQLREAQTQVAAVQPTVQAAQAQIDAIVPTLAFAETRVAGVEPTLAAANAQVAAANAQVAAVQPTVQAAQAQIDAIVPTLAFAETRVAGVEPTLNAANTQVAGVEPTLAQAETQIAGVQPTLSFIQDQVVEQRQIVDALRLVRAAQQLLDTSNPDLAMALVLEAYRLNPTLGETQRILNNALPLTVRLDLRSLAPSIVGTRLDFVSILREREETLLDPDRFIATESNALQRFSPDERFLALARGSSVEIWSPTTRTRLHNLATGSPVSALAFSPDGQRLLGGLSSGQIVVWDAGTGQELRRLVGHSGAVLSIAYHPDLPRAISGSDDRRAILWNVDEGQQLGITPAFNSAPLLAAFNANGSEAYAFDFDIDAPQVGIFRLGVEPFLRGVRPYRAISPNGVTGVRGSDGRTFLELWDADNSVSQREFRLGNFSDDFIRQIAFSNDNRSILVAAEKRVYLPDRSYRVNGRFIAHWDIVTGGEIRRFDVPFSEAESWEAYSLAFSPDDRLALVGARTSKTYSVLLYDVATGREVRRWKGHQAPIVRVAFSPLGTYALSTSEDGNVRVWDARSGDLNLLQQVRIPAESLGDFGLSADGARAFVSFNGRSLAAWDLRAGQELRGTRFTSGAQQQVIYNPLLPQALVRTLEQLTLYNLETTQIIHRFDDVKVANLTALAFSADGQSVWYAEEGRLYVWDSATPRQRRLLLPPVADDPTRYDIRFIAPAPNREYVALILGSSELTVYDLIENRFIWRNADADRTFNSLSYSPDSGRLLTALGEPDNTLVLWDAFSGRPIYNLVGHSADVLSGAFGPDGTIALSGGLDTRLILWDLLNGQIIREYSGHTAPVRQVVFVPAGGLAYSRSDSLEDGLLAWSVQSARETVNFAYNNRYVPPIDCQQRQQYGVQPLCGADGVIPPPLPTPTSQATATVTPTATPRPTQTPTNTPTPRGILQGDGGGNINIRSGAGPGFSLVTQVPSGTPVEILEVIAEIGWTRVLLPDGQTGWVRSSLIRRSN